VESPGFVTRGYLIARDGESRSELSETLPRLFQLAKVIRFRAFEKSPLVDRLTFLALILDSPHPVPRWAERLRRRIGKRGPAFSARCLVSLCGALDKNGVTAFSAGFRILRCGLVSALVKLPALSARHYVAWMSNILRKKITGEKIILRLTMGTGLGLYPNEVLDGCRFAARVAPGNVIFPDSFLDVRDDSPSSFAEGIEIKRCQRLLYNPEGHRVDVRSHNVKSKTVGLVDRRAAPHEGIRDNSFEIVCPPV
jgi:hypothetical protein